MKPLKLLDRTPSRVDQGGSRPRRFGGTARVQNSAIADKEVELARNLPDNIWRHIAQLR